MPVSLPLLSPLRQLFEALLLTALGCSTSTALAATAPRVSASPATVGSLLGATPGRAGAKPVRLLYSGRVVAADGTISGRVVDSKGQALPGVTVLVEGTTLGSSTNADGTFSITGVPVGTHTLVISFVGFTTVRQAFTSVAGQNASLSVKLAENVTALGEAVVVGYGTQSRQDVTGSVTTVTTKDFVKGQVTSPEQLVQGKVAGVQITTGGGAPGEVSVIRIRGGSSLNASNDPLIVIDGVPVDNQGINGAGNPLSLVNPNDIETFTVLKDASATAIYGSRASNGVILITTKKGVDGEAMHVNVSSQLSRAENYGKVPVLGADAYRLLCLPGRCSGHHSGHYQPVSGHGQHRLAGCYLPHGLDHRQHREPHRQRQAHVPYRVSMGVLDQDGTLLTSNLKRNSVSIGLSPRLLDNHLRHQHQREGHAGRLPLCRPGSHWGSHSLQPDACPFTAANRKFNGYTEYLDPANGTNPYSLTDRNPLALLTDKRDRSTVLRSIGNIQLDYKLHFLPDLHAEPEPGLRRGPQQRHGHHSGRLVAGFREQGGRTTATTRRKTTSCWKPTPTTPSNWATTTWSCARRATRTRTFIPTRPSSLRTGATAPGSTRRIRPRTPSRRSTRCSPSTAASTTTTKSRYLFTGTLRGDGSSHFREQPLGLVSGRLGGLAHQPGSFPGQFQRVLSDLKLRA